MRRTFVPGTGDDQDITDGAHKKVGRLSAPDLPMVQAGRDTGTPWGRRAGRRKYSDLCPRGSLPGSSNRRSSPKSVDGGSSTGQDPPTPDPGPLSPRGHLFPGPVPRPSKQDSLTSPGVVPSNSPRLRTRSLSPSNHESNLTSRSGSLLEGHRPLSRYRTVPFRTLRRTFVTGDTPRNLELSQTVVPFRNPRSSLDVPRDWSIRGFRFS